MQLKYKLKKLKLKINIGIYLKVFIFVSIFLLTQNFIRSKIFEIFNNYNPLFNLKVFDTLFHFFFDDKKFPTLFQYLSNIGYSICASIIFYWFLEYNFFRNHLLRHLIVIKHYKKRWDKQLENNEVKNEDLFKKIFLVGDIFLIKGIDYKSKKSKEEIIKEFEDSSKKEIFINESLKKNYYDYLDILTAVQNNEIICKDFQKFLSNFEKEVEKLDKNLLWYIIIEDNKKNRFLY